MAVNFEIEKHIAKLGKSSRDGFTKELNLVSWNNRKPKYDIRPWDESHSLCQKGITLSDEEMEDLKTALSNL